MHTEFCRINSKAEEESKMHIGVPAETRAHETRVAAPPETVKKYVSQGHRVTIRSGAATGAGVADEAFSAVGAEIVDAATAFGADLILKVQSPTDTELPHLKRGAVRVDPAAGRGPEYEGRRGDNCPLTEADKVVTRNDVQIIGYTNLALMVAAALAAVNVVGGFLVTSECWRCSRRKSRRSLPLPVKRVLKGACNESERRYAALSRCFGLLHSGAQGARADAASTVAWCHH
jgi:NAD/NADP transhydrogenase alpha subunit